MIARRTVLIAIGGMALATAVFAAACGSSTAGNVTSGPSASVTQAATPGGTTGTLPPSTSSGTTGALPGEAAAAATGDIPDNQMFLTLSDTTGGFSMKYPEGWAQKGSGNNVTISDKNNIVHITVATGSLPSVSTVNQEMVTLKQQTPSLSAGAPVTVTVASRPAVKVTYTTVSAPNPVTGKSVTLIVNRYYFAKSGRVAVVDLATPVGVDNVDAYRMMSASFAWLH
jgi:hypothetical protein